MTIYLDIIAIIIETFSHFMLNEKCPWPVRFSPRERNTLV